MRPLPSSEPIARLVSPIRGSLARFFGATSGATMIEYSLLTAIMAAGAVACMTIFGASMKAMFDAIVGYYTLAQ